MAENIKQLLPFIVNATIVVIILYALLRKPARRFVYQRHERLKDFVENSARVHAVALKRQLAAVERLSGAAREAGVIMDGEMAQANAEAADIARRAEVEAARVQKESIRLVEAMGNDISDRMRAEFVDQIVSQAEDKLRAGLGRDDHGAIFKRAQTSIEVSV